MGHAAADAWLVARIATIVRLAARSILVLETVAVAWSEIGKKKKAEPAAAVGKLASTAASHSAVFYYLLVQYEYYVRTYRRV